MVEAQIAAQDDAPQPVIAHPNRHMMGDTLLKYVKSKIHPDIDDPPYVYSRIVIMGTYQRHPPFRISPTEKEKFLNYERPSTRFVEPDILEISCLPGRDYMFHYASLVATHLSATGRDPNMVELNYPDADACYDLFLGSNLRSMGTADTVIIGYVTQLCGHEAVWETGETSGQTTPLFSWSTKPGPAEHVVSYLGCTTPIWGDIAGQLIRALVELNRVRRVVYCGKGGSLSPQDMPNHVLGTGESSEMRGRLQWRSGFGDFARREGLFIETGNQVNVPSPLVEDAEWFQQFKDKARWVDCEVGYLARACTEAGLSFDYCMVVSDNLAVETRGNLTNERQPVNLIPRQGLLERLRHIVAAYTAENSAGDVNMSLNEAPVGND